uniref:Uncharacterized protein n=1 Tax=Anguilla anguilla TaxID=7936 RepID=A0A0E9TYU3_ANGAN
MRLNHHTLTCASSSVLLFRGHPLPFDSQCLG